MSPFASIDTRLNDEDRFSEKLHHIVTQEQDSNFITRLHNGDIDIIPWPLIESKRFYTMFEKLRKTFYSQKATHPGAGVFLSTMKTLMAKLKVCKHDYFFFEVFSSIHAD